eukprot:gene16685-22945_t
MDSLAYEATMVVELRSREILGPGLARRWLFFLYMPTSFRQLSHATFLAQQAMLPYPRSRVKEETLVEPYTTHIVAHYSGHQSGVYHTPTSARTGEAGTVELWIRSGIPTDVGPKHVDSMMCSSDGVWHPDCPSELSWSGSGSRHDRIAGLHSPFNPFASIETGKKVVSFTERLKYTDEALQWCLPTYGLVRRTTATRGNQAVASQDKRGSLSKPSYLALGALRSYSFGQFRRLCAALCQRSFPLDHPAVRTTVVQAMYHLGKLYAQASGKVDLKWRALWHEPGDVLSTLGLELDRLADELEQTPREHDSVLLLGTISAYLSAWHEPCILTARRFARMVSVAADSVEDSIQQAALAGDDRVQLGLRERQSHLRKISLMCYASGPFDDEDMADDVSHMVELMVLINHGCIFTEGQSEKAKQESTHLHVRCQNTMAMAVDALMGVLLSNPGYLTDTVSLVLPSPPESLDWRQLGTCASFEAEGADGHLYSINILDGNVMLDGSPPSRLPRDIVTHSMYRRAFGDINFEVVKTNTGALKTLKPVKGHQYTFTPPTKGGPLVVTEEASVQGHHSCLELLNVGDVETAPCEPWGAELPVRIRQLHSHWLCRAQNIIVVRPVSFLGHDTYFVICCNPASMISNQSRNGDVVRLRYSCLRIPLHLMQIPWPSLLEDHSADLNDELVLDQQSSLGLNILAKLEASEFIHAYYSTSGRPILVNSDSHKSDSDSHKSDSDSHKSDSNSHKSDSDPYKSDSDSHKSDSDSHKSDSDPHTGDSDSHKSDSDPHTGDSEDPGAISGRPESPTRNVQAGSAVHAPMSLLWELPRYGLEFTYRDGTFISRDYAGFKLADEQQLASSKDDHAAEGCVDYTLPNFQQYLVLERMLVLSNWSQAKMTMLLRAVLTIPCPTSSSKDNHAVEGCVDYTLPNFQQYLVLERVRQEGHTFQAQQSDRMIIVPEGLVALKKRRADGGVQPNAEDLVGVSVTVSQATDASLKVHCYEVHPRFGHLVASSILSRLQLAALYSATSSLLPEPRSLMTGAQMAMRLVRWSSTNRPLAAHEEIHLESVAKFGVHQAPGLQLLCLELERSSSSQKHLYETDEEQGTSTKSGFLQDPKFASLYLQQSKLGNYGGWCQNSRMLLQPSEEASAMRIYTSKQKQKIEQYLLHGLHGVPEHQSTRDGNGSIRRSFRMLRSADGSAVAGLLDLVEAALHAPDHLLTFNPFLTKQSCKQYAVAKRLIQEPGAIAQLNMGEGKTRVILPMLVLHLAKGKHLVRLNFLSTLLSEAGAHLQNHICASVLGRKVFIQPFNRDVELTASNVKAMTACLLHCQRSDGILIVEREHRLSLQLKAVELLAKGDTQLNAALDALAALPYIDILDESDELLQHRYQLIYAVGAQSALPARQQRAEVIQCLLHAVSHQMDSSISTVLSERNLDVRTSEPNRPPGSFCRLRLVSGKALEEVATEWHRQLATLLMDDPPYELSWICGFDREKKGLMRDCILLDDKDASEFLGQLQLLEYQKDQLLALRGLLARNVLRHCLEKRHLVDFGVNRSPSARKRLAVPYRAANTPSERSEFAQPDVALTFTMLAYYSDGLSRDEFRDALRHLLQMGKSSQQDYYNAWLTLSRSRISPEDLEKINDVARLDDSNPQQLEVLFRYYSHNMACVDFWLNFIVFKVDTHQFPQRVAHHSWHMADNPLNHTVGFSGTNDNHRLLPLQVHQAPMEETALKATNGKMLSLILKNKIYLSLPADDHQKLAWQLLLETAVEGRGHDALIDCGAILADTSNRNAAAYLLRLPNFPARFKGVVYFDTALQLWMALERRGRCQPLQSSPLAERDAFVIFDDARCRGADMKLRSDAVGLLTIGPGMVKDKMMQAAGRLRQLDKGQRLSLVGTADVSMKIAEFNNIDLVSDSSISSLQATIHGVAEWVHQGLHYMRTTGRPSRLVQSEVLGLEQLYADGRMVQDLGCMVQKW